MVPFSILWSMPCKSVAPGSKTQLAEIATFTASPRWYKHVLFRSGASHGCITDVFPPSGSAHTCNTTFRGNQEWKRRRAVQNFGVKFKHEIKGPLHAQLQGTKPCWKKNYTVIDSKIPAFLSATTNQTLHKRAHTHTHNHQQWSLQPPAVRDHIFFKSFWPTTCYNSGFRSQFTCSFDVHGPHSARNGWAANQHPQRKDPEDPNLMCHFQNRSRYVFLFHTCSILNIESHTLIL